MTTPCEGIFRVNEINTGNWTQHVFKDNYLTKKIKINELFLSVASPKVILLDPAPIVRALPGFIFSCSATGFPPIDLTLIWKSIVLVRSRGTASIRLYQEGNYSCVATNSFGTDIKEFSVIFTGKNSFIKFPWKNCP